MKCGVCSLVPGSMSALFHSCSPPFDSSVVASCSPTFQTQCQGLDLSKSENRLGIPECTDPVGNLNPQQDHLPKQAVEHALIKQSEILSPLQRQTLLLEGATEDMNGAIKLLVLATQNPKLTDADITVISKVANEMHSADGIIRSQLHHIQQQELSIASQACPPPVPGWMDKFLHLQSSDIFDPAVWLSWLGSTSLYRIHIT